LWSKGAEKGKPRWHRGGREERRKGGQGGGGGESRERGPVFCFVRSLASNNGRTFNSFSEEGPEAGPKGRKAGEGDRSSKGEKRHGGGGAKKPTAEKNKEKEHKGEKKGQKKNRQKPRVGDHGGTSENEEKKERGQKGGGGTRGWTSVSGGDNRRPLPSSVNLTTVE